MCRKILCNLIFHRIVILCKIQDLVIEMKAGAQRSLEAQLEGRKEPKGVWRPDLKEDIRCRP